MTEAEKFHQDRRTSFQSVLQIALIDFIESGADDELDTSPGMTGLREVSRFMGDTMFRMYEGTPIGEESGFTSAEQLIDHIFNFCSKEAAKTFLSLKGEGPLEIEAIHPPAETVQ
jgi:hypothetical protein